MSTMRHLLAGFALALALFAAACESPPTTTTVITAPGATKDAPELAQDEATRLVRDTNRNVSAYQELRMQGKTQKMEAVRQILAGAVDRNWETFRETALEADTVLVRNMATKCIGFAFEKRTEARDTLLVLCGDRDVTIVANAVLGLGILLHKQTDLTPVISLLGHGSVHVRTNAASALTRLFLVKETPRTLTPQYYTAIDRLVTMLHDKASTRSRRAAAWALANLRHPDVLAHLVSALQDDDEQIQIGGLRGLEMLGDQRALEPVLEYLEGGPTSTGVSWAVQVLQQIAVQGGFAETTAETKELGDSPRSWRRWFRQQRMK